MKTSKLASTALVAMLVLQSTYAQPAPPEKPLVAVAPSQVNLPISPAHRLKVGSNGSAIGQAGQDAVSSGYEVLATDATLRDVLVRWAKIAGWSHNAEHWAVDRDLPVSGTADSSVFGQDFKSATRKLLTSSELTDRPVQPCFYSNKVLRVVPKAELCDRSQN